MPVTNVQHNAQHAERQTIACQFSNWSITDHHQSFASADKLKMATLPRIVATHANVQ